MFSILLGGCAHVRHFDPATSEGRAEVNSRAWDRSVVVRLSNGQNAKAKSLWLGREVATWNDAESDEAWAVPLARVEAVRFPARGRGVLEGIAIGVPIGIAFMFVGLATEGQSEGFLAWSTEVYILLGALTGAEVGALVGLAAGRTIYIPRSAPETNSYEVTRPQN